MEGLPDFLVEYSLELELLVHFQVNIGQQKEGEVENMLWIGLRLEKCRYSLGINNELKETRNTIRATSSLGYSSNARTLSCTSQGYSASTAFRAAKRG